MSFAASMAGIITMSSLLLRPVLVVDAPEKFHNVQLFLLYDVNVWDALFDEIQEEIEGLLTVTVSISLFVQCKRKSYFNRIQIVFIYVKVLIGLSNKTSGFK